MEDQIGKIFRDKFGRHQEEISLSEIERMNSVFEHSFFYKWYPHKFNIYYALMIVSGFVITLLLAGHYVYTIKNVLKKTPDITEIKDANHQENPNLKSHTNHTTLPDSNFSVERKIKTNNLNSLLSKESSTKTYQGNPTDSLPKNRSTSTISTDKIIQEKNTSSDMPSSTVLPLQNDSSEQKKVPQKRTVVIVQQDTIYQIDTLRGPKNRKRKR